MNDISQIAEAIEHNTSTIRAEFEKRDAEISALREELDAIASAPQGRKSGPGAGRPAGHNKVLGLAARHSSSYGFETFGHFAASVRSAALKGGSPDDRLMAALTSFGNEAIGADGGFAVPPTFIPEVMAKTTSADSLLSRTMQVPVGGNSLTVPTSMTLPWDANGVQARWSPEASPIAQSRPALESVTIRLHKLAALVPLTEELLEDAPAMSAIVSAEAARAIDWAISEAIFEGTGAGQPLGFMNAPALVTSPEQSPGGTVQGADTIIAANISDMLARLPVESRTSAVWLVHPSSEPQLHTLTIGDQPIYLPPGGFSSEPFARLMGRPVIPHQVCKPVGDLGDIVLVDLSRYLVAMKQGGMKAQTSVHLWFDQDAVAFKFTMRVAGQPWWSQPTAAANGTYPMSPFVALAARDGS